MWVFARHFIKEDSKVLSWYDTGSARHSQKLPKKLPNTALFDRFGQTHRQTHKKPLRPILNGLSGISNWSGRQDCFAISLRSSNPRCGLRRIAAARLLSNPAAQRQKNPSRKREGFNFGRGDRIASPSRCARRTRGAAYAASPLRGSFRILPPSDKKTLLASEKGLILVGATGFEPATLCSQSRCASQAAPRPVSKRRRQTITNFTPVNAVSKYSFKLNVRDFKPAAQTYLTNDE